jgi:spermidine synthase
MAVIWEHRQNNCHYEVRLAGESRRLYKDGVFHSQWNPTRPLSNGVWDLLFLPSLFREPDKIQRVLVLGVGGGAVINAFTTLLCPGKIVGVELDPMHIKIAREHFLMPHPSIALEQADAVQWVKSYRGERFDVVIEDLFIEENGEPVKARGAGVTWFRQLRRLVRPGGVLVMNFESPAQMREAGAAYCQTLGSLDDIRYQLTQPAYGNSVCAFLDQPGSPATMRNRLADVLADFPACRASGQKFKLRRVV